MHSIAARVRDAVSHEALEAYLTADYGQTLLLWPDGHFVLQGQGTWSRWDEEPLAAIRCPGIENLDSHIFTEDFVAYDDRIGAYVTIEPQPDPGRIVGDLAEVIAECVRDGDVTGDMEDFEAALLSSAEEAARDQAHCAD